jgi:hypothetical protein
VRSRLSRWVDPDERRSISGPALLAIVVGGSVAFLAFLVLVFGDVPLE